MAFKTISTFCSKVISGARDFFTKSSGTLGHDDTDNPTQLETTQPLPTATQLTCVSKFHIDVEMNVMNSNSSSAEASSLSSSSAVDDFKEARPPWVHETMFANPSPAHGIPSRSPLQLHINNQEISLHMYGNSQETLHPIIRIFQQQELGRHLLVLAIPMIIALFTFSLYNPLHPRIAIRAIAVILALGAAAIWAGILLRETCPSASIWMEFLGVALIFLVFYGFVAWNLPIILVCIPTLCWFITLLPFVIVFRSKNWRVRSRKLPCTIVTRTVFLV